MVVHALRRLRLKTHWRAARRQTRIVLTNPSNRGHRWERALAVARFEVNSLLGRPTIVKFARHSLVLASKGGNSSKRAVFTRLPDWPEMVVWQAWLRPGDLFVDVGANVGLYSLLAAEAGSTVIAVEPASDMAQLLRANVSLNEARHVTVHEVALLDEPGWVHLSGPDPNRRRALATEGAGGIEATTVDILVGPASVRGIKIDVEGNERLVLEGCQRLIADDRVELLQLEWNRTSEDALGESRAPVAALLRAGGFELFRFTERGELERFAPDNPPGFGRDIFAARAEAARFIASGEWRGAAKR